MSPKLAHLFALVAFLAVLHKSAGATTAINKDEMQERLCALDVKYCNTDKTMVKTETENETEAIALNGADEDNQNNDDKNGEEIAESEDDDDTEENKLEETVGDAAVQGRRVTVRRGGRRGSRGNRRRRGNRKNRRNGRGRINRRRKGNRG